MKCTDSISFFAAQAHVAKCQQYLHVTRQKQVLGNLKTRNHLWDISPCNNSNMITMADSIDVVLSMLSISLERFAWEMSP
jgi:hypothetical protein